DPRGRRAGLRRRAVRLDQRARRGPLPARLGGRDHEGLPAQRGRQDAQARAARSLLGRPEPEDIGRIVMNVPLDHAHLFASNLSATVGFFRTMFGATVVWDEAAAGVRAVRLALGSAFLVIYDQPPKAPRGGAVHHLGIATDDLDA